MASAQKELIRHESRARRASIPGQLRLKAAESLAVLLPAFLKIIALKPGSIVGCYLAIGTEINTSPLLRTLQKAGYQLALPRTIVPSAPLEFVAWQTNEPLQQDLLGFPAPAGTRLVTPDAVLIPLVAFDRAGGRIGQGAGLYDRTLSQLRRNNPDLPVAGVAFACQEVESVPFEPHDQPLDYVLTENSLIQMAKELDQQAASL